MNVVKGIIKMKGFGRKVATKELSKWWWIRKITHAFIEGNMTSNLDLVCLQIEIVGMAKRTFVLKEDTRASMNIDLSIAIVAGKSIDLTTKDTKKRDIGTLIFADFIRRLVLRSMGNHVMDHKVIAKCIWPKLGKKIDSKKHGANSISNGAMRMFNGTFFRRGR